MNDYFEKKIRQVVYDYHWNNEELTVTIKKDSINELLDFMDTLKRTFSKDLPINNVTLLSNGDIEINKFGDYLDKLSIAAEFIFPNWK